MPLVLADRVRETTTTTGTGTISLAGPVSGFQGFSTAIGNANTTYYTIVDAATGAWEVGLGTYTSAGSTLARTTVLSSSNSDALVPFGAGTKDVFVTQPAERAVYVLGAGTGLAAGAAAFTANGVPYADSTSTLATSSNLTFNGTTLTANALTTTSTVTINGGTANGVAYLNGSKVLTTGSALTFDGNNFAQNGPNAAVQLLVNTANSGVSASNYSEIVLADVGVGRTFWRSLRDGSGGTIFSGNDHIRYALLGSEQMRLTSTGLGVGTSSPGYKLHVSSTASTAGYFTGTGAVTTIDLDNTNANGWGSNIAIRTGGTAAGYFGTIGSLLGNTTQDLAVYATAGNGFRVYTNGNNERMRIDSSGNIGIGTSSPANTLNVVKDNTAGRGQLSLQTSTAQNFAQLTFYDRTTLGMQIYQGYQATAGLGDINIVNTGAAAIKFWTTNTDRMTLDAPGNLGLGVTPSAWGTNEKALQIGNSLSLTRGSSSEAVLAYNAYVNSIGTYLYNITANSSRYEQLAGQHRWYTAPSGTAGNAITFTQAMTLESGGQLLIGTTTKGIGGNNATALTVAGGATVYQSIKASGNQELYLYAASGSVGLYSYSNDPLLFGTNNTERARIDSSGNFVGAGTTSIIYWEGVYNNTTASAANMFVASNGSFGRSTSALKYKQDIRDLGAVNVDLLRPVRYKSKCENDDQTKDHFGLIADEAADAGFEELVTRGSSGEVEGFQYERLTVVLLKEIQSLRQRVAQLEGA